MFDARAFVNYYNGHPFASSAGSFDLANVKHVTVIGQGNVALDVARILLKPVEELKSSDLPEEVLEELRRSKVDRVDIIGRRGPLQLKGTTKELREMLLLKGVGFDLPGPEEALLRSSLEQVELNPDMSQGRMKKRALGLLLKGSKTSMKEAIRSWSLGFLLSPTTIVDNGFGSVGAVEFEVNELVASGKTGETDPSTFEARGAGKRVQRVTDMVMKSVGYRSVGIPGLPFDERRGVARNEGGRIVNEQGEVVRSQTRQKLPLVLIFSLSLQIEGLYSSGWLSRGPNGVIATTMYDAFATADLVASDLSSQVSLLGTREKEELSPLPIEQLRGGKQIVSWKDWEKLDRVERERGEKKGKEREKVTKVEEMLDLMR